MNGDAVEQKDDKKTKAERLKRLAQPEVADPAAEVEAAVPETDDGILTEQDCLRSVRRLRELGEHYAGHARLA